TSEASGHGCHWAVGDFAERAVSLIVIEKAFLTAGVRYKEIGTTVIVIVAPGDALRIASIQRGNAVGNPGKRAVPIVMEKTVQAAGVIIPKKEVGEAVVIEVRPGSAVAVEASCIECRLCKSAVAVITIKKIRSGEEEIKMSVVVEISPGTAP